MNVLTDIDIRNFKRIRKAHLTLEGHTFVISGDNGTGKSSFLDGIAALFGGKDKAPAVPVRKGAKEAVIIGRLKTKAGQVLKATVTFAAAGGRRLVVEDAEGKAQSSPQTLLDSFWAETSFDPSLFLAADGKTQVAMLKKMLGLDFTALDTEKAAKFSERTIVNRDLDRVKALAVSLPHFPDAPVVEVSSSDVLAEIERASAHNRSVEKLADEALAAATAYSDATDRVIEAKEGVAALKQQLEEAVKTVVRQEAAAATAKEASEQKRKVAAEAKPADVSPLKAKLAGLEEANRKVRANVQRADAAKAIKDKQVASDKLTERLEEIDATKEEMLQKAPFPIPGMSINENGVIVNGLPLEQESDSQKVAIGVEMSAILNPDKPLMLVRHGNLFTPTNFKILDQIAEKRGLTCIVEVPGDARADTKLMFVDGVGTEPGAESTPETASELPLT